MAVITLFIMVFTVITFVVEGKITLAAVAFLFFFIGFLCAVTTRISMIRDAMKKLDEERAQHGDSI